MPSKIVHPSYYRIIRREGADWFFKQGGRVFYNPRNVPIKPENIEAHYELTEIDIIVELFRINGGKPGYYLANLRERKYHYCGGDWEDIPKKLMELGIGRVDPMERKI